MEDYKPAEKRICPAMVEAGIYNPTSQEGIDFCIKYCPYDYCIVVEEGEDRRTAKRNLRTERAKKLVANGLSVEEVATELRVSTRTVLRYLAK